MTDAAGNGFAERYPRLHHFLETVLRPEVDGDNLLEMLHRVMRHWHPTFVEELVDLGINEPWRAYSIGIPVVAMYGALGREHHRDGADYIADLLSDRDPIVIADAGHNGPFTHPESVAAVVRELESRAPA